MDSSPIFGKWFLQKQPKVINIIKRQNVGTKTQLKIWNRFFLNRPTIFSLDCCRERQFYRDWYHLPDQSPALYAQFFNKESRRKRLNRFKGLIFVDSDNTFHNTNFTTINAAWSSYQTILLYALHSEVWSFVWKGKSSKSQYLHQRDLERSHSLLRFFSRESLLLSSTWYSPNFDFSFRKGFLLSPMFQLILTRKKRKMMKSKQMRLFFKNITNGSISNNFIILRSQYIN